MIPDIPTMIWKEWREILLQRGTVRGGLIAGVLIPVALLGILIPWQSGPSWVHGPTAPIMWTWLPMFLVATMIADSFAGERERHTLETLLASRLSDDTILFGKAAASVLYGWGLALVSLTMGLITVNVVHGKGTLLMFPLSTLVAVVVLSLLGSALAAGGGVLISLRAATVRQAQQTLSYALMILMFGGMFGFRALPSDVRTALMGHVTGGSLIQVEAIAGLVFLALDAVLLSAARARFRRARLILD